MSVREEFRELLRTLQKKKKKKKDIISVFEALELKSQLIAFLEGETIGGANHYAF